MAWKLTLTVTATDYTVLTTQMTKDKQQHQVVFWMYFLSTSLFFFVIFKSKTLYVTLRPANVGKTITINLPLPLPLPIHCLFGSLLDPLVGALRMPVLSTTTFFIYLDYLVPERPFLLVEALLTPKKTLWRHCPGLESL